jgi:hypothetical protein
MNTSEEESDQYLGSILNCILRCSPLVYLTIDMTPDMISICSEEFYSKLKEYLFHSDYEMYAIGILGYASFLDDGIKDDMIKNKLDEYILKKLKDTTMNEEMKYFCVKCLCEISDFQEFLPIFISHDGMVILKRFMKEEKKYLLNETFQWINSLLVHNKFSEMFMMESHLLKDVLKYQKDHYFLFSIGNMICQLLSNEMVMENLKNLKMMDRMIECGLDLIKSSEYKKLGGLLFQNGIHSLISL